MSDTSSEPTVHQASAARVGRRVGAVVFDGMLFIIVYIGAIYSTLIVPSFVVLVVLIVWVAGYVTMQAGSGTLGMKLLGMRLVRSDSGARPGIGLSALRNVVFALSALIVVGPFSVLLDRSGMLRGWHDRASNTRMIMWDAESREALEALESGAIAAGTPGAGPELDEFDTAPSESYTLPSLRTFEHLRSDVDDVEATRLAAPRVTTFSLVLADGMTRELTGVTLIGRNPAASSEDRVDTVISIDDPTKSMSKTHALLELRYGSLFVTDWYSTNGSKVLVAGAEPVVVPAGEPLEVPVDALLQFGDYLARVVRS